MEEKKKPLELSELSISQQQFSKYFNLSILNDELISSDKVEKGSHGLEILNGEFYASLYHIKNQLSEAGLKTFMSDYNTTELLKSLGKEISENYSFPDVYVKYENLNYSIKKYPLKVILHFFIEKTSEIIASYNTQLLNSEPIGISALKIKNFGRFEKDIELKLSKINFFVGPNNTGKSTVSYALSTIISYINSNNHSSISWNSVDYPNKTFVNVLNRNVKLNEKERVQIGGIFKDCSFLVIVHGSEEYSTSFISNLKIDNPNFRMDIDFSSVNKKVSFFPKGNNNDQLIELKNIREKIDIELSEIEQKLINIEKNHPTYLQLISEKNIKEAQYKKIKSQFKKENEDIELNFEVKMFEFSGDTIYSIFQAITKLNEKKLNSNESNDIKSYRLLLDRNKNKYANYLSELYRFTSEISHYFIAGTAIKFPKLITKGKQHDSFIGCLQFLKSHHVFENDEHWVMKFIEKWIGKNGFDFGEKILVNDFENEVFTIKIKNNNWEHLSELGLGAQRLFELIINVSTVFLLIDNGHTLEPIVFIEEPEAHIHPSLQSKLANFFYEVNEEYNICFIVETHSEYLIRKSQLIVKDGCYENESDNPFNVVYFDKENGPYEMKYRQDGKFMNEFGSGFFDESTNLAFDLF